MARLKVSRFYGMLPRVADELLPTEESRGVNYAKTAINVKLESGNLRPFRRPIFIYTNIRPGDADETVRSFRRFEIKDGSGTEDAWLIWPDNIDLIIGTQADTEFKYNGDFYYYTSDATYPKMSYGDLIVGNKPFLSTRDYPAETADHGFLTGDAQFALGIPAPEDALQPEAEVQNYSPKQTQGYERDSSNFATITTQEPHGLRTGNIVSIDGFGERTTNDPIVVPPIGDDGNDDEIAEN